MKYKEPKYAVIYKPTYRLVFVQEIDWETESSVGRRGVSFDAVRYKRSTGEMYSKRDCKIKVFDTPAEASAFKDTMQPYLDEVARLEEKIREQFDLITKAFDKHEQRELEQD